MREAEPRGGFTLVELLVFIAVIGIVTVGVFVPVMQVLSGAGQSSLPTQHIHLAKQRMELIIAIKRLDGFPGVDPCETPGNGLEACNVPAGFTVESSIDEWAAQPGNGDYRVITVTVTPPGTPAFTVQTLIARLEP